MKTPNSRSDSNWISSILSEVGELSDARTHYLRNPWDFALGDPEGRYPAIIGPDLMERAAKRPVLSFSKKQKGYLRDFCDVRIATMITKTGRGGSKTMCSSVGEADLAYCLPTFTCTVNAGSFGQVQENYRYWETYGLSPEMRAPRGPIVGEPKRTITELKNGGWLRILAASETQAKAPHPMLLVYDEATAADTNIMLLVEGQLVGASPPYGAEGPLYRIQSTPDKLYHLFRDRWESREDLGYYSHEWGARDCPWMTEEHIQKQIRSHDRNWARIFLEGEFGSATGTIFRKEDIDRATIPTLQEDPYDLWPWVEEDFSRISASYLGIDWGAVHPTVLIVLVKIDPHPSIRVKFPKVPVWPQFYVVHCIGYRDAELDFLFEKIVRAAVMWNANSWQDSSDRLMNLEVKKRLGERGFRANPVSSAKFNSAMIGEVRRLLENGLLNIPMGGGSKEEPLEGFELLRQLSDYSYEEGKEKPIKKHDDYVDALKFAAQGLSADKGMRVRVIR